MVRISDSLVARLGEQGRDIERQALEALVLETFRSGRMKSNELRDALGFETLNEVDGFIKSRGLYEPYTVDKINRQVATLEKLGY